MKSVLLLLLLLFSAPAWGFQGLTIDPNGPFLVVDVVDADTVVLEDGREVRFVGVQAPKLPLGRKGFEAWPLAREAKERVAELLLGQDVTLAYGGRRVDRYGRILAHLFLVKAATPSLNEDTWVQGWLLGQGLARVYSFADNRSAIPEMLAREREARQAGRGIWGHDFYRIKTVAELERRPEDFANRFELVEGRVKATAVVRGRAYINFGPDWREDFTVTFSPKIFRSFEAEGLELSSYEGRNLRIRGWLKSFNGPMIEATHPEQIEVLEE